MFFINLYFPGLFAGPGIGTFLLCKGCQWVAEPDLSPLLYKPEPVQGLIRKVLLPNIISNV
jgi:hypothetical protein